MEYLAPCPFSCRKGSLKQLWVGTTSSLLTVPNDVPGILYLLYSAIFMTGSSTFRVRCERGRGIALPLSVWSVSRVLLTLTSNFGQTKLAGQMGWPKMDWPKLALAQIGRASYLGATSHYLRYCYFYVILYLASSEFRRS